MPATQAVQVPPLGPEYPRLQLQAEMAVCPVADVTALAGQAVHVEANVAPTAAEYVPRPQSVHAAEPVSLLYFPAAHAVHGPPSGPVNPASHGHKPQPNAFLPVIVFE